MDCLNIPKIPGTPFLVRDIFERSYDAYSKSGAYQSGLQRRAAADIMGCKTPRLGFNLSRCPDCGYEKIHYCSCRNRSCPNCQAVKTELWVDQRRAEVIDTPYFHVVFTLPHELNPLLYCNQALLYGLLHKCCSLTLLELARDKKYLGATPGIIQVLHTWNQELDYHVHMHCIISGGGLTTDQKLRRCGEKFFLPVHVLRDKFKGKYLALLETLHSQDKLVFSGSCEKLRNSFEWKEFKNSLYEKDWCPYIKETFNGFGNAIEYLGRYTHRIAISNRRILSVSDTETAFSARGIKPGDPKRTVTLPNVEFIRRFLMHVLPSGFQKIRYYGFLNNRSRRKNLALIFKLQGHQRFRSLYTGMTVPELVEHVWKFNPNVCPACGCAHMEYIGKIRSKPGG